MFPFKVILIISFFITIIECAPMSKTEGQEFLKKYGYMSNESNDDFKKSIQEFQEAMSLPVTGQLDSETSQQMERPRCGHPDRQEIQNNKYMWDKTHLTYKFVSYPTDSLSASKTRKEIRRAFQIWSEQVPLKFEEKSEGTEVDIDITFNKDGDGPGKTLAYAYFPKNGNVHFDKEAWTSNSEKGYNLYTVAAHEIGHSLGLGHSQTKMALMFPFIAPFNPNLKLHNDDVSRIQNIYGKKIDICNINKISSVFYKDGYIYIMRDKHVWKMNNTKQIESEYPKEVSEEWKGCPSIVDAAYTYKNNIYFHQGPKVWLYDGKIKKANIDKELVTNIDAALTYQNRIYIFKDMKYYRYDNMKIASEYPKDISSYWTDIPNSIDGVYYDESYPHKYFYFFKGNKVFKFNMDSRSMIREMSLREYLSC